MHTHTHPIKMAKLMKGVKWSSMYVHEFYHVSNFRRNDLTAGNLFALLNRRICKRAILSPLKLMRERLPNRHGEKKFMLNMFADLERSQAFSVKRNLRHTDVIALPTSSEEKFLHTFLARGGERTRCVSKWRFMWHLERRKSTLGYDSASYRAGRLQL